MFNYCLNLSDKHIEILYFASKHVFLSQLSSSWPYEFLEIQWWQNDRIVGAVSEFRRNQDNSKNNILVSQKQKKTFKVPLGLFIMDGWMDVHFGPWAQTLSKDYLLASYPST